MKKTNQIILWVLVAIVIIAAAVFGFNYFNNVATDLDDLGQESIVVENYDAESWKTLIPSDCQNFYDGCNECFRVEGTDEAGCTRMACEVYEEPKCRDEVENLPNENFVEDIEVVGEEPIATNPVEISDSTAYTAESWKTLISSDCQNFYDGCNNCFRIEGGEDAGCTMMYCDSYEQPRCTDGLLEEIEGLTGQGF